MGPSARRPAGRRCVAPHKSGSSIECSICYEKTRRSRIKTFELGKKPAQIFWLDPNTGIAHLHLEMPLVQPLRAYFYVATLIGELYGVRQKIIENLLKFLLIKCSHLQSRINGDGKSDLLEIGHSFYDRSRFFQCLANQELFRT